MGSRWLSHSSHGFFYFSISPSILLIVVIPYNNTVLQLLFSVFPIVSSKPCFILSSEGLCHWLQLIQAYSCDSSSAAWSLRSWHCHYRRIWTEKCTIFLSFLLSAYLLCPELSRKLQKEKRQKGFVNLMHSWVIVSLSSASFWCAVIAITVILSMAWRYLKQQYIFQENKDFKPLTQLSF